MKYLIIFTLLSCSSPRINKVLNKPKLEDVKVSLRKLKKGKQIRMVGESESCFVRWVYKNNRIEMENYQCMLPLEEADYIITAMLERLMTVLPHPENITGFSTMVRNFTDIEQRVALHAYKTKDWDEVEGLPKKGGSTENFVFRYIKSENAAFELTRAFARKCYNLKLVEIREADILRASGLPYYPWLRLKKVKRKAKVPTNYFMDFEVSAKHQRCFKDPKS